MEKQAKSLIGISLIGLTAYWAYNQFTADDSTTIGGSGSFAGLGGSESTSEGGLGDIAGTSDSGISYNINLPSVDTAPLEAMLTAPTTASTGDVLTTTGAETPIVTKKEAVISASPTKGSSTLNSLSTSLSQVFGTEAQKTNERGDYYTTAAGGGAGAIKGLSLGEQAINLLSGKTASGKSTSGSLPTGTSTESRNLGLTSEGIKAAAESKKQQTAAIAQTKIAAPTATNKTDLMSYLKSGGTLTNQSTGAVISAKKTASATPKTTVKKTTVSLAEAKKGSSRISSSSTGKVIKVKR